MNELKNTTMHTLKDSGYFSDLGLCDLCNETGRNPYKNEQCHKCDGKGKYIYFTEPDSDGAEIFLERIGLQVVKVKGIYELGYFTLPPIEGLNSYLWQTVAELKTKESISIALNEGVAWCIVNKGTQIERATKEPNEQQ